MDKTGTVTEGRPRVVRIHVLIADNCLSLLKMFAAIGSAESNSEHPIASSIASFVKEVGKIDCVKLVEFGSPDCVKSNFKSIV